MFSSYDDPSELYDPSDEAYMTGPDAWVEEYAANDHEHKQFSFNIQGPTRAPTMTQQPLHLQTGAGVPAISADPSTELYAFVDNLPPYFGLQDRWREPEPSNSPFISPVESQYTDADCADTLAGVGPYSDILPFGRNLPYDEPPSTYPSTSPPLAGLSLETNFAAYSEAGSGFPSSSAVTESEDHRLPIPPVLTGRRSRSFGDDGANPRMFIRREEMSSSSAPGELPVEEQAPFVPQGAHLSRATSLNRPKSIGMSPIDNASPMRTLARSSRSSHGPYERPRTAEAGMSGSSSNHWNSEPQHSFKQEDFYSNPNSRKVSHTGVHTYHSQVSSSSLANALVSPNASSLDLWAMGLPSPETSRQQDCPLPSPSQSQTTFEHSHDPSSSSAHIIKKIVASNAIRIASEGRRKPDIKGKGKIFPCHLCEGTFTTKVKLQGHINSHNGVRPFQCKALLKESAWGCLAAFARACDLTRHRNTCKQNPARQLLKEATKASKASKKK